MTTIISAYCDVCDVKKDCVRKICPSHYFTVDICENCLRSMILDIETFKEAK